MQDLIRTENLSFRAQDKTILDAISMHVASNEIVTIIGPNGAGKTSLLRILIGLEKPSTGHIYRKKNLRIGYMPQKLELNPYMPLTVAAFLRMSSSRQQSLEPLLQELNIDSILQSSMHDLSGGERQRVLLARAMIRKPDLLVLDEPAQGVDINGQNRLYQLIQAIQKQQNCAVLMVSHDLHLVMAQTDRVICLNQHICCHGHPDNISQDDAYLNLFGKQRLDALAPYTHHHDHHHDLHGDVIKGKHHEGCNHDH